jgi:2-furoyl-CoA dehydrogenase FAD binding subunit
VKPASFDYFRVDTAAEAVALLGEHGDDARILAGGQSLVAMMNMRLTQPRVLIDISRAADLDTIQADANGVRVGAAARQAALGAWPALGEILPLAAAALPHVGHFQTRNRGTVCGSIAHADPGAELPLVLATLDGAVLLRGPRTRRTVAARDFFTGMLTTARAPDELIEAVRFPAAARDTGHAFDEIAPRHGDFAIVSVAACVGPAGIAVGVGGVADRPEIRQWPLLEGAALDDALNDFAWELGAVSDHHASAAYRRNLVRRVGRRVIEAARP